MTTTATQINPGDIKIELTNSTRSRGCFKGYWNAEYRGHRFSFYASVNVGSTDELRRVLQRKAAHRLEGGE